MRAWSDRPARERAFLAAGAGALAALLLIALVWLPLERARARLAHELPVLRASVATLQRQADEVRRLRAMPAVAGASAQPLAALAAGGAPSLPGAQLAVLDVGHVRVAGSDVGFAPLLEWLASTQAAHGLHVESARIDALPATGRVRVDITLARP